MKIGVKWGAKNRKLTHKPKDTRRNYVAPSVLLLLHLLLNVFLVLFVNIKCPERAIRRRFYSIYIMLVDIKHKNHLILTLKY